MYCPKCSQQQVSDEVRFCSRCGFPLSTVRELVVSGGVLAEREAEPHGGQLSPAFKGMRKGVWIMLASLPVAIVAGLLTAINDSFAVFILLAALCVVAGFARLLYGAFIEEKGPHVKRDSSQSKVASLVPVQRVTAARSPELPSAPAPPIEGQPEARMVTADMGEPPSVTENTTRLLDEEADSHVSK